MMGDQAVQGRAMFAEIALLKASGLFLFQVQQSLHIKTDPLLHLREEAGRRRIKRVVEVENTTRDLGHSFAFNKRRPLLLACSYN